MFDVADKLDNRWSQNLIHLAAKRDHRPREGSKAHMGGAVQKSFLEYHFSEDTLGFPIKNYLKGQRRILHTRDDDGLVIFRPPCFLADHLQVAVHDTPLGSFFLVFTSNKNMSQKYFSRQEKTFLSVGKGHSKEKMVRAHRNKKPFVFPQKLLLSCSTISQIKV